MVDHVTILAGVFNETPFSPYVATRAGPLVNRWPARIALALSGLYAMDTTRMHPRTSRSARAPQRCG